MNMAHPVVKTSGTLLMQESACWLCQGRGALKEAQGKSHLGLNQLWQVAAPGNTTNPSALAGVFYMIGNSRGQGMLTGLPSSSPGPTL